METPQMLQQIERMREYIEKLKGKNMDEFDELLAELGELETVVKEDTKVTPEKPEKPEPVETKQSVDDLLDEGTEIIASREDALDTLVGELKSTIMDIEEKLKQAETMATDTKITDKIIDLDIEFKDETISCAKEILEKQLEKKAIDEEIKSIKEEYKDQGVNLKAVNTAISEIKKEMKETPQDAQDTEALKEILRKETGVIDSIQVLNG